MSGAWIRKGKKQRLVRVRPDDLLFANKRTDEDRCEAAFQEMFSNKK